MSVRSLALTGCLVAAMTGLPVLSSAGTKTAASKTGESDARTEAFTLLKDFHAASADAADHAMELQAAARSETASWQTHANQLRAIADYVNVMGRELSRLEKIRDSASPLERKAIEAAAPLLRQLADNTTAAISRLNENRLDLWSSPYTKYIDNVTDESARLSDAVGKILKLSRVHDQEVQLEKAVGMEASAL